MGKLCVCYAKPSSWCYGPEIECYEKNLVQFYPTKEEEYKWMKEDSLNSKYGGCSEYTQEWVSYAVYSYKAMPQFEMV